jgi:hypothetical protein
MVSIYSLGSTAANLSAARALVAQGFYKPFTRLPVGFSKKIENLEAACALHMAYHNFCWRPGEMRITPAMAAGVTDWLWSFDYLLAA